MALVSAAGMADSARNAVVTENRGGERGEEEVLEVRPPPGSGGSVLRLRVLDAVRLRVGLFFLCVLSASCIARLLSLSLLSLGFLSLGLYH